MRPIFKTVIISTVMIITFLSITYWSGLLPTIQIFPNNQSTNSVDESQYLLKQVIDIPITMDSSTRDYYPDYPNVLLIKPVLNVTNPAILRVMQVWVEGNVTEWKNITTDSLYLDIYLRPHDSNESIWYKNLKIQQDETILPTQYVEIALPPKESYRFLFFGAISPYNAQSSFKGTVRIVVVQTITKS